MPRVSVRLPPLDAVCNVPHHRASKYEKKMSKRGHFIVVDPADRSWLAKLGFASVDQVLKYKPETMAAISGSSETFPVEVGPANGAPQRIYIKRYRYRGVMAPLKGMFRGTLFGKSRAKFEYDVLAEMRRRAVHAVRPIAYGEKRSRGFLKACFLITEGVTGAPSLDVLSAPAAGSALHDPHERRRLIEVLARDLRNMHRGGVKHGGLFWRNILVTRAADGTWHSHLIDPDRRGRCGNGAVRRADVVSDLADLVSSGTHGGRRADLIRFLRAYWEVPRLRSMDKMMARDILREAGKRAAREVHRFAIGESIDWLRRRVEKANMSGGEAIYRTESISAFFAALPGARNRRALRSVTGKAHFTFFTKTDGLSDRYTVTLTPDDVQVTPGLDGKPDLSVQTDPQTWLAIVNAQSDAFERVQQQRIRIEGDTNLLPAIAELIDIDGGIASHQLPKHAS